MAVVVLYTSNTTEFDIMEFLNYGLILMLLVNMIQTLLLKQKERRVIKGYSIIVSVMIITTYFVSVWMD